MANERTNHKEWRRHHDLLNTLKDVREGHYSPRFAYEIICKNFGQEPMKQFGQEGETNSDDRQAKRYRLDPDFRRDDPRVGPYCVRCQKKISDPDRATRVTVDWESWLVTEGGDELIGPDCWKVVKEAEVD
jgi:hypothetical protein